MRYECDCRIQFFIEDTLYIIKNGKASWAAAFVKQFECAVNTDWLLTEKQVRHCLFN